VTAMDVFSRSTDVKIAVIGGGTGSFTVLSGLKNHSRKIAALVNMADDGGSTGKLRDELGVLPPGDIRQCLVALSRTPELRDLFNYRFDSGSLKGHAFGNLFLTALEKMTGDFAKAVELASGVLNIAGTVEPITLSNIKLGMRDNSQETIGQFEIENMTFSSRPDFFFTPEAVLNPRAAQVIEEADIIVIAPGNLYISLAPALIVPGVGEALARARGLKVYVCNLVTKPGQTDGFYVNDFADEIERLAGTQFLDAVLYNTENPSDELLDKYAREGEKSVQYEQAAFGKTHYNAYGVNLLSNEVWQGSQASDPLAATRSYIRHDSAAVAKAIMDLYRAYEAE
jgi:uncharacterized cofD-like protein